MTLLLRALAGMGVGLGLWLAVLGFSGQQVLARSRVVSNRSRRAQMVGFTDQFLLRAALATGAFLLAMLLSRWPMLAITAAGVGCYAPTLRGRRGAHDREMAIVEGIATWTEQIRDTLAAANGLEHALSATAALAPRAIAADVQRLAVRMEYERLPDALRRFADDVDHPMADFVVAALVTASEKQARDLGSLLTHLSESARGEALMRSRVWVGRARNRSAVRIIVSVVATFVVGLLLLNRAYLKPYDSAAGQMVLAIIIAIFATSFVLMQRMGRLTLPQRFIGRRIPASVVTP